MTSTHHYHRSDEECDGVVAIASANLPLTYNCSQNTIAGREPVAARADKNALEAGITRGASGE